MALNKKYSFFPSPYSIKNPVARMHYRIFLKIIDAYSSEKEFKSWWDFYDRKDNPIVYFAYNWDAGYFNRLGVWGLHNDSEKLWKLEKIYMLIRLVHNLSFSNDITYYNKLIDNNSFQIKTPFGVISFHSLLLELHKNSREFLEKMNFIKTHHKTIFDIWKQLKSF